MLLVSPVHAQEIHRELTLQFSLVAIATTELSPPKQSAGANLKDEYGDIDTNTSKNLWTNSPLLQPNTSRVAGLGSLVHPCVLLDFYVILGF